MEYIFRNVKRGSFHLFELKCRVFCRICVLVETSGTTVCIILYFICRKTRNVLGC